ncbi:MAG: 30S ribosomal protein S20 [bacterium]
MPHHRSALKRIRQDNKRRERNKAVKSEVKTAIKQACSHAGTDQAISALRKAESIIDRAAKKGVIHWRNAARKKSRLARKLKVA